MFWHVLSSLSLLLAILGLTGTRRNGGCARRRASMFTNHETGGRTPGTAITAGSSSRLTPGVPLVEDERLIWRPRVSRPIVRGGCGNETDTLGVSGKRPHSVD